MSNIKLRIELEKRIVGAFVRAALKAGYRLAVSLDKGYDVDEMLLGSTDIERIMEEAFAGDEAHIFIQPAEGPTVENGRVVSLGWVYIVLGNDGWDVISDYTVNPLTEELLTESNKIADSYA
jgi:hypothetical protein